MPRKTATKTIEETPSLLDATETPPQTAEQAATGKAVAKRKPGLLTTEEVERRLTQEPSNRIVPVSGLSEVIAAVERIAMNPNANVDVADRILAMQERLMDRAARLAFNRSFVQMTAALPAIPKKGRILVQEKTASGKRDGDITQNTPYAKWETTAELIKPILREHGFGIQHRIATVIEGADRRVRVTAVLRHDEGHVDDSCYFDLAADSTGSKNNAQAWASSVSYAKRHTAFATLGLIAQGEDDDATTSGKPMMVGTPMTEEEAAQLVDLARAADCPWDRLRDHLNKLRPKGHPAIEEIADLPAERFKEAAYAIAGYEANRKAREDAKKGVKS